MRARAATLLVLGVALAAGSVVDLDAASLQAALGSGGPTFVKFYAPWCAAAPPAARRLLAAAHSTARRRCGHCKRLTPTWTELADAAIDGLTVGRVDCTKHAAIRKKYGVYGYPTLLLFDGLPPAPAARAALSPTAAAHASPLDRVPQARRRSTSTPGRARSTRSPRGPQAAGSTRNRMTRARRRRSGRRGRAAARSGV